MCGTVCPPRGAAGCCAPHDRGVAAALALLAHDDDARGLVGGHELLELLGEGEDREQPKRLEEHEEIEGEEA